MYSYEKKKTLVFFLLVLLLSLTASASVSAGWKTTKDKHRYYDTKTKTYVKAKWKKIGKKWYYFDAKGYLATGRFKVGANYYYCKKSTGRAQKKKVGNYYYGADGAMVTNCWKKCGKSYFYFGADGKVKTGRFTIAGKTYYCSAKTGRVQKKRVGDYYYDKNGVMVKNKWVGGYYYGSDGKAKYGKITVGKKTYYVKKKTGMVKKQWVNKNYYGKDGVMATSCWINGTYVDANGKITKGIKNPKNPPSDADIKLLSALVYCEAGNQSYEGKIAVASVVINRMESKKFPNTLRGVIYQSGQFTPAMTGWLASVLNGHQSGYSGSMKRSCQKAATEVLTKGSQLKGYYYFNLASGRKKIGDHWFS